jgi:type III secretion system IpaD/SipD/SspD family effector
MTDAITTAPFRGHSTGSVPQARASGTPVPDRTAGNDMVWLAASLQCAEQCAADGEAFLEHQDRMKRDAMRYQTEAGNLRASLHDPGTPPHVLEMASRMDALSRRQLEKTSEGNQDVLSAIRRAGQSTNTLIAMLKMVSSPEKSLSGVDDIAPRWHSEFFDKLIEGADDLYDDWIKKYEEALKKFIEFFDEFSKILREKYIVGGDEKEIKLHFYALYTGLEALMAKYGSPDNGLAHFSTEAEAKAFIDKLGLSGMTVKQAADGSYAVMVDIGPVQQLYASLEGKNEHGIFEVSWNISKYNAWVSSKDSIVEQLRHASQVLGEKYSRNLQIYDSVIKAISSTIDSINEADKAYIHNLL